MIQKLIWFCFLATAASSFAGEGDDFLECISLRNGILEIEEIDKKTRVFFEPFKDEFYFPDLFPKKIDLVEVNFDSCTMNDNQVSCHLNVGSPLKVYFIRDQEPTGVNNLAANFVYKIRQDHNADAHYLDSNMSIKSINSDGKLVEDEVDLFFERRSLRHVPR
jgi:hypothetical protein